MAVDKFVKILAKHKIVTKEQVLDADELAKKKGIKLAEALVELEYATEEQVMKSIAAGSGMEYVNLKKVEIPTTAVELMPESTARENTVLPLEMDGDTLKVVMSEPGDVETVDNLKFILNRNVKVVLATRSSIISAISNIYGQIEGESADSMLQEFTDTKIDFTETVDDENAADDEDSDENSAPIVRLVKMMITEAVQLRCSDIHIEPFEDRVRVRYRIDGVLRERDRLPRRQLGAIISRVKILASIDIAERRRPQDGRIKVNVGEKELDLRVSIIPTNNGQSAVLRLLDKDNIKVGVRQLGFSEDTFEKFQNLIKRPNGIVLVTGPTGSGKTTTLYAAINSLNRPDRKIITILVGEMRDSETAQMGIEASLTGHLVFSTLHTNDAPSAITRMIDMGVPGYLVASSVVAILAQRLVRTICKKCRTKFTPSEAVLKDAGFSADQIAGAKFMRGKGCNHCGNTGFRGRMGIHEILMIDVKVREMIFANTPVNEIRDYAMSKGMVTLYGDGLEKVVQGYTTIDEIYRVAKRTEQDELADNASAAAAAAASQTSA